MFSRKPLPLFGGSPAAFPPPCCRIPATAAAVGGKKGAEGWPFARKAVHLQAELPCPPPAGGERKTHGPMSTVLYPSPIFGPVHSRRLGISLGINLMPPDGKLCTFDCVYCECGFNATHRPSLPRPTREEVCKALEAKLLQMEQEGRLPDVLTFAGNGEPTAHPHFPEIAADTLALRDRHCPAARVSVLSNATFVHKPAVREALMRVDNNIQKLDTADAAYIRALDRPTGRYSVEETIENLRQFGGHVIIQTMFLKGSHEGQDLDNTSDRYVLPWLEALRRIGPQAVMVYTIDRETPEHALRKASPGELDRIAALVREAGIPATASY